MNDKDRSQSVPNRRLVELGLLCIFRCGCWGRAGRGDGGAWELSWELGTTGRAPSLSYHREWISMGMSNGGEWVAMGKQTVT